MERKLVRNNDEFYELCKHWNDIGYSISIFKNNKNNKVQEYPVEYPCVVLIEEVTYTYNDLDYNSASFHYVYKSDFDVVDEYKVR
jgi:hypothetical protein